VIDAHGKKSRQVDLVLHRNDYHPVFEVGGIKHFLIESVVAVIENKATIDDRKLLREALANIRSVKVLDRLNLRPNRQNERISYLNVDTTMAFGESVFGVIATEKAPSRDLVREVFNAYLSANDRRLWPNLFVSVGAGHELLGLYERDTPAPGLTVDPWQATRFALTRPGGFKLSPLIYLAFEIANLVRLAGLWDYSPADYLLGESAEVPRESWPIP